MNMKLLTEQLTHHRKQKNSDKVTILSTMIGELQAKGTYDSVTKERVVTDEQVVSYIKSYIKNLEETLSHKQDDALHDELLFVKLFLPVQMTPAEIREIISQNSFPSVKELMAFFKANFGGKYDGKVVVDTFKSLE